MKHYFERCSGSVFVDGNLIDYDCNDAVLMKQFYYRRAGLILDYERDICIRNGYGALVFCCGLNNNLDDVISKSLSTNFYDFDKKMNDGYKFVIGPGIYYDEKKGSVVDYAVYCSNYEEVIDNLNGKSLIK